MTPLSYPTQLLNPNVPIQVPPGVTNFKQKTFDQGGHGLLRDPNYGFLYYAEDLKSQVSLRTNRQFRDNIIQFTEILAERLLEYDRVRDRLVVPDPLE